MGARSSIWSRPSRTYARGIGFRSLTEQIDTTNPGGKLIFHVFRALAEFERDLIQERSHASLTAARARGLVGGRPSKLTPGQAALARRSRRAAVVSDAMLGTVEDQHLHEVVEDEAVGNPRSVTALRVGIDGRRQQCRELIRDGLDE